MFNRSAFRLSLLFDPLLLSQDLLLINDNEWISHYNNKEYEGDWAILPLRSVGGHPMVIHAVPGARQDSFYKNTPILERTPYFKEVVSKFECNIGSARLMRLGPGAKIHEHSDFMGADVNKEIRIHIPVKTNEEVLFMVNHELFIMNPGETWYADFELPHSVINNGNSDRIHLVLDCDSNKWMMEMIEKSRLISSITAFLNQIGISTSFQMLNEETFLPGIVIQSGTIVIDPQRLVYPGDILHEAGHIAVTLPEERHLLHGNVNENDKNAMGQEIATILWSYAALVKLNLSPEVVFHSGGYKGHSEWYIENFQNKNYIGLPLLEWMGFCSSPEKAKENGTNPFPDMLRWLR